MKPVGCIVFGGPRHTFRRSDLLKNINFCQSTVRTFVCGATVSPVCSDCVGVVVVVCSTLSDLCVQTLSVWLAPCRRPVVPSMSSKRTRWLRARSTASRPALWLSGAPGRGTESERGRRRETPRLKVSKPRRLKFSVRENDKSGTMKSKANTSTAPSPGVRWPPTARLLLLYLPR